MNTTINAEPNLYDFHCQVLFIQTTYKLDEGLFKHNCYVYSQWWYCADRSYAFLNMGGVRSRKYCASISDMTTMWSLRREVVLRINLPRASIEAWRMLWHLSSNGSRDWLRYWGRVISAARSVQLVSQVLLNEVYHYQTRSLFEVKTDWVHRCAMTMAYSLCHQSSSVVG